MQNFSVSGRLSSLRHLAIIAIGFVLAASSITPSTADAHPTITTTSAITTDQINPEVVVVGTGFKADGTLVLSDFTITDEDGTGLTADSVSVNDVFTVATITFTGTAITGVFTITANASAFTASGSSSSNTLTLGIGARTLPACPASDAITVPCLDSGTISRNGLINFRLLYSNNSDIGGSSFSLQAEIAAGEGGYAPPESGDAADLVILYPTSSAIGGRLAIATWAMAGHADFTYAKTVETINDTEVVKLTTSYVYRDSVSKSGCGVSSMTFGAAPEAACESVGDSADYQTSADLSIDFFAAGDFSWLVAETGADGGYLNYVGSSFMWGSTDEIPLRFQLVGPRLKSADDNDPNSGSFQVYLPAGLVTFLYGADFNPETNLVLTRHDEGTLTGTLSGTADVSLTRPLGGDLLIDVPDHPFSAPVFAVSSVSTSAAVDYLGPVIRSPQLTVVAGSDLVLTGSKLGSVSKVSIAGTSLDILSLSDTQIRVSIPADFPSGTYDLVIESNFGKLTVQSALVVMSAAVVDSDPGTSTLAKPWTKKLTASTVKIYTKDLVGAGKVQFMLNGNEVAWVNATSSEDPKLRNAGSASYLVRTVNLVPGRKNVIEIWVAGVRASRTAYSY